MKRFLLAVVALGALIVASSYVYSCDGNGPNCDGSRCDSVPAPAPDLVSPHDVITTFEYFVDVAARATAADLQRCNQVGTEVSRAVMQSQDKAAVASMDEIVVEYGKADSLFRKALYQVEEAQLNALIARDAGDLLRVAAQLADTLTIFEQAARTAQDVTKSLQTVLSNLNEKDA